MLNKIVWEKNNPLSDFLSHDKKFRDLPKNSFKSALKVVISPLLLTNDKTCQFALGPLQRDQV